MISNRIIKGGDPCTNVKSSCKFPIDMDARFMQMYELCARISSQESTRREQAHVQYLSCLRHAHFISSCLAYKHTYFTKNVLIYYMSSFLHVIRYCLGASNVVLHPAVSHMSDSTVCSYHALLSLTMPVNSIKINLIYGTVVAI